mmetsp:Transcript_62024/g.115112  ORF Transcript_62024/g.115112 Transcript_62024/m.115112 type:complete len:346 (-) Transcript_62024:103-1140(-)
MTTQQNAGALASGERSSRRSTGALLAFLSVLVFSPDPLLVRLAQVQQPAVGCMLFTKYAFKTTSMLIVMLVKLGGPVSFREDCRRTGWHFWAAGLFDGLAEFFYNMGLVHSVAATAMFLTYLLPIWTLLLNYVIFRKKPAQHTLAAVILAVCCGGLILWGSAPEEAKEDSLFGKVCSLLAGFFWSSKFIVVRDAGIKYPDADLVGITVVSSAISMLASIPIANFRVGSLLCHPSSGIWGYRWLFLDGAFVLPLGYTCNIFGLKYCSASVVSLMLLLDGVLAPLWVWIGIGETPPVTTLIGGAALLITLAAHETQEMLHEHEDKKDIAADALSETSPLITDSQKLP